MGIPKIIVEEIQIGKDTVNLDYELHEVLKRLWEKHHKNEKEIKTAIKAEHVLQHLIAIEKNLRENTPKMGKPSMLTSNKDLSTLRQDIEFLKSFFKNLRNLEKIDVKFEKRLKEIEEVALKHSKKLDNEIVELAQDLNK